MSEQLRIIASRRNYDDTHNIQIHDIVQMKDSISGFIDMYATVTYKGSTKNLLVMDNVYRTGESPYVDEVIRTPYLVIEDRVYYLDEFESLGMEGGHVPYKVNPPSEGRIPGVLYAD